MSLFRTVLVCAALCLAAVASPGVSAQPTPKDKPAAAVQGDIPTTFAPPTAQNDYVKRVEMIPMRDGVKLYTVIWVPKGAKDAPIVLTRTPYDAAHRQRGEKPTLLASLGMADEASRVGFSPRW